VCCFPIYKNNELVSILYLENKYSAGVFNASIIEFLKTLSFQVAISLENALLFEEQKSILQLENDYKHNLLVVSHLAEEKEKSRIAEELHDNIGALLSTTKLYLNYFQNNFSYDVDVLQKVDSLLEKSIQNLRNISHRLSPSTMETYGLISSIETMCNEINDSHKLTVNLQINSYERLPLHKELHLYRIIQELLNNGIKHSNASLINLSLEKVDDEIVLEYVDNGVGFDIENFAEKANKQGLGFQNIKNRAEILRGQLLVVSKKGEGVKITITIKDTFADEK
jgi:signal transduction histidine kinase